MKYIFRHQVEMSDVEIREECFFRWRDRQAMLARVRFDLQTHPPTATVNHSFGDFTLLGIVRAE